jgi:hypothetical protein
MLHSVLFMCQEVSSSAKLTRRGVLDDNAQGVANYQYPALRGAILLTLYKVTERASM